MNNPTLKPLGATIGYEELLALATSAAEEVQNVRGEALAPSSRKIAPKFSAADLAELCGIDKAKVLYWGKKDILPAGTKERTRLEWTLAEARQWVQHFRKGELRDPTVASAVAIAIANFKGGVTKTTTAAALAQGLSLRGHRVLVIDCDPQGSLTTLFGVLPDTEVEEHQTIMNVIAGKDSSLTPAIRETYWDGIDLVCAAPLLFSAEFLLPARQMREDGFQFWTVLDNSLEEARAYYDVIIIDTPPTLSYVTINALMAAQGVIMPLPPNTLDFASSAQFWNLFTDVCSEMFDKAGSDKRFNFVDVLLTRVDRADAVSQVVREWIKNAYGSKVLAVEIPKTSIAATASASFGTVYDMTAQDVQMKTLRRALDHYNQFVEHIEMQVKGVWAADALPISSN